MYGFPGLGITRFVHQDDTDHHLYHQDQFNKSSAHAHVHFDAPIDELKFDEILTQFVANNIVTADEKMCLMVAYQEANL